jgi:Tol biopolymer transport system component
LATSPRDTLTKITDGLSGERTPSLSPDGRRIAFEMRVDNFDTVDIPLDRAPIVDVLAANRAEFSASRAKDGRIVYVSNESGYPEIRVRSTDGTDRAIVTPRDFPGEIDRAVAMTTPSVSPDGQRVLFARLVRGQFEVWIAPMSGGTPVRAVQSTSAMSPVWSPPDGRWIAFLGEGPRLARQRVGSSEPPQVLVSAGVTLSSVLAWSPDGRWIAPDSPAGVSVIAPKTGRAACWWRTHGRARSPGAPIRGRSTVL